MNFQKLLSTENGLVETSSKRWFFLILFITCFIFYGNTLQNGYNLDDNYAYTDNKNATNGLSNIKSIFTENTFSQSDYSYGYRPITTLSFAIENELFGINSTSSHLINILIYFSSCCIFLLVIGSTFPNAKFGTTLTCVFFFTILPIHTEIVNNVKSRDELLMLLFCLSSTYLFLQTHKKTSLIIPAIIFLILGILSKKTGLIFLGIIPTAIYFQSKIKVKYLIGFSALIFLAPLAIRVMRKITKVDETVRIYTGIENPLFDPSIEIDRISFSLNTLWFYFKKILFTNHLVSYYGYHTIPIKGYNLASIATILIFITLTYIALKNFKRKSPVSFGIIVMFGGLLPFVNWLIPLVGIVAERFATVATIGLSIFIPFGIIELLSKFKKVEKPQLISMSLLLLYATSSFFTIQARNKEWKSDETLFAADVIKEPNSATLQALIGKVYINKIPKLSSDQLKVSLGKKAISHLEKSVSIFEDKYNLTDLGSLYFRALLNYNKAKIVYNRAIQMDSNYADPHYHLGWVSMAQKDTSEAIQQFRRAIEIKPSYIACYEPLIKLLIYSDRKDEALLINTKALEKYPSELSLILNQANVYYIKNDFPNAILWFEKYLSLQPNNQNIRNFVNQLKSKPINS